MKATQLQLTQADTNTLFLRAHVHACSSTHTIAHIWGCWVWSGGLAVISRLVHTEWTEG